MTGNNRILSVRLRRGKTALCRQEGALEARWYLYDDVKGPAKNNLRMKARSLKFKKRQTVRSVNFMGLVGLHK